MENDFYTNEDIQLLTGKNYKEAELLIRDLNNQLKTEYKKYHIDPLIQEGKILKDYFIKRMEINL